MTALDPRRAQNVGASEIPALFSAVYADETASPDDLVPSETRYGLWHRKKGNLPEADEPARAFNGSRPALRDRRVWGNALEEGIAKAVGEATGWAIDHGGFVKSPTIPGMSATPDFVAYLGGSHRAALEIKNVDRLIFNRWPKREEPGVSWWQDGQWRPAQIQPPFRFKLQCQAQVACLGFESSITAPLVGGNELFLFRIDRHDGVIFRIEAEILEFWQSIKDNRPPEPDWQLDAATIAALHGSVDFGSVLDLTRDGEALALAENYHQAQQEEARAKALKDGFKAQILHRIEAAERVIFGSGYKLWAGTVKGGHRSFDVEPHRGFLLTHSEKHRR